MSTEATGGGQPGAEGAGEPEVAAEGAEPAATALAAPTAWDTATPSAWGATGAARTGDAHPAPVVPEQAASEAEAEVAATGEAGQSEADESEAGQSEPGQSVARQSEPGQAADGPGPDGEPSEPGRALEADEADVPGENDEPEETEDRGEVSEPAEADDPDDAAEYDEGYDDFQDDETAAEYADDGEYEPAEDAQPQHARRWPRVLLALGFVVLAAVIVGGAIAIVGSVTHGFQKPVKVTYTQSALFSLKTGECFNPQGQSYSLISCDSPHQAEVFATFALSGTTYPGATAIATQASDGCTTRLTGYVNPQLALSLTSTYVYPDSVAWQAGTRTVICEVRAASGTLTGSVRSASAS